MPLEINQDVLRLEIAIDNIVRVQVLKSQQYLSDDYPSIIFDKTLLLAQMVEKFTNRAKLKHKMEILL